MHIMNNNFSNFICRARGGYLSGVLRSRLSMSMMGAYKNWRDPSETSKDARVTDKIAIHCCYFSLPFYSMMKRSLLYVYINAPNGSTSIFPSM